MTRSRFDRYRQLSAQLGDEPARALIDRLQVLALTQADTLREIEVFIDRGGMAAKPLGVHATADRRLSVDRRRMPVIPEVDRRRGTRRACDRAGFPDA
jgi:hypothetical protein